MKNNKYILDFNHTFPLFKELIHRCSILSDRLLKHIDFHAGSFFTFLPDTADLDRLYDLRSTGVAPDYPEEYTVIASLIHDFFSQNPDGLAVFEDTIMQPSDRELGVEGAEMTYFRQNIFFLLKSNASLELIYDVLRHTQNLFQSLTILTNAPPPDFVKLSEDDLNAFCKQAKYVMTMAYDGDAYLIWKRNHE